MVVVVGVRSCGCCGGSACVVGVLVVVCGLWCGVVVCVCSGVCGCCCVLLWLCLWL